MGSLFARNGPALEAEGGGEGKSGQNIRVAEAAKGPSHTHSISDCFLYGSSYMRADPRMWTWHVARHITILIMLCVRYM